LIELIVEPVLSLADLVTLEGFPLYCTDAADVALAVKLSVVLIFTLAPEEASTTEDFVTKSPAETELPLLALITLELALPDSFKELPLLASKARDLVSRFIFTLTPDETSNAVLVEILKVPETCDPDEQLAAKVLSLIGFTALKEEPDLVISFDNFGPETITLRLLKFKFLTPLFLTKIFKTPFSTSVIIYCCFSGSTFTTTLCYGL